MIARPTLTALGCRSCQHAMYRAVLRSSTPAVTRFLPFTRPANLFRPLVAKSFSTEQKDADSRAADTTPDSEIEVPEEKPWFLDEEPPRHPSSLHKPTLPNVPDDAPPMLEAMLKYVYEDMGLDELSMLDLRDLDPPASLGPNLIMLFATARSERHLHVSSGRFVRWLKREHNVGARAEGLIGAAELKTKLRRLRKKAKLMGQNTNIVPGGDNGISTGWICVNFRTATSTNADSVTFDESGRMSGFGASENGTTIVVQCMTEARRAELDLEKLWVGLLKRNLIDQASIRGETTDASQLDALLASKLQLHQAPGESQFEAMKTASQQHRYYTTSARRLQSTAEMPVPTPPGDTTQSETRIDDLSKALADVQLGGAPVDQERLGQLVSAVLMASPETGLAAADRLALVDQLLQTGAERGLNVRSRAMLITLIESLVKSPAYGPELGRAQQNFELLLLELQTAPESPEVVRLMNAYASKQDWDRFWEIFRARSRFNLHRSREMYKVAFQTMASTGDAHLCTEALRWTFPEMLMENPPVRPRGPVLTSLKACIRVADPQAEEHLRNPPDIRGLDPTEQRRLLNREFIKMLRHVDMVEAHVTT